MPRLAIAVLVLAPIMTSAQGSVASRPIAERALHTMRVPGYADFLALDGDHAWVTNQGRVDRLAAGQNRPVASVPMAEPCGGMAVDFGALWVVNNKAAHSLGSMWPATGCSLKSPPGWPTRAVR